MKKTVILILSLCLTVAAAELANFSMFTLSPYDELAGSRSYSGYFFVFIGRTVDWALEEETAIAKGSRPSSSHNRGIPRAFPPSVISVTPVYITAIAPQKIDNYHSPLLKDAILLNLRI
ncbi:MAG: hypothetical protein LBH43_17630 [Treponema sp.]|nr:hypothetical protein [Treponema sp.]